MATRAPHCVASRPPAPAGSTNLELKEDDLLETLELLCGRKGLPEPPQAWAEYMAAQGQLVMGGWGEGGQGEEQRAPGQQGQGQQGGAGQPGEQQGAGAGAGASASPPSNGTQKSQAEGNGADSGDAVPAGGPDAAAAAATASPTARRGGRAARAAPTPTAVTRIGVQRVGGLWLPPDHPLAHIETRLRHGGNCDVCK